MQIDKWTNSILKFLSDGDRSETGSSTPLPDYIQAIEDEINSELCDCGAEFGDHSYNGHFCPNPGSGPLFLYTRFSNASTEAATLRDINAWIVNRGANA